MQSSGTSHREQCGVGSILGKVGLRKFFYFTSECDDGFICGSLFEIVVVTPLHISYSTLLMSYDCFYDYHYY